MNRLSKMISKRKVGVVFNDAGAMNLTIPWLQTTTCNIRAHIGGSAQRIWERAFPEISSEPLHQVIKQSDVIICGTGWGSRSEHLARKLSKKYGKYCIGILDHWSNYSDRFKFNEVEILPNEAWVTDSLALKKAKSIFQDLNVHLVPNLYLKSSVDRLKGYQNKNTPPIRPQILYLCEPIKNIWPGEKPPEFQALDYFRDKILFSPFLPTNTKIVLRPHPAESAEKYAFWKDENKTFDVVVDSIPSLEEQMAQSCLIVGCNTYALVIAAEAGLPATSSMPPWGNRLMISHPNLIPIDQIEIENMFKNAI